VHDETGVRGLFDGLTGTWLRQMSYSLCRFWAYDEAKAWLADAPSPSFATEEELAAAGKPQPLPAHKLALAGTMGE
jgi:hypothetical protein